MPRRFEWGRCAYLPCTLLLLCAGLHPPLQADELRLEVRILFEKAATLAAFAGQPARSVTWGFT